MAKIKQITAREILNSLGKPTIEVKVTLDNQLQAQASAPSSILPASYESLELRDQDPHRYQGQGVLLAIAKVIDIISPALEGLEISDQAMIDQRLIELDDSKDKRVLGANTMMAVSLACARAAALAEGKELFVYLSEKYDYPAEFKLPVPLFNIFNGGAYADTNLDFQEFLLIPRPTQAETMVRMGAEVFSELAKVLKESNYDTDTGLEGGYAPDMDSSIEALEFIIAAITRAGYRPGEDLFLGLDIGSSSLYDETSQKYIFPLDSIQFSADNLIGLYNEWLRKYPLIYLEDPLAENDWSAWRELSTELGGQLKISGDDIFATSSDRLRRGIKEQVANTVVVKPGQAGTLTETIAYLKLAQSHGYELVISHRSGETNDDFIVDLAVACGAQYLKAGSLSRGERLAKYNRLLEIEEILNKQ